MLDEGIHYLEDGNFYIEVDGLPAICEDHDKPFEAKKPSRLKFDTKPIRVNII